MPEKGKKEFVKGSFGKHNLLDKIQSCVQVKMWDVASNEHEVGALWTTSIANHTNGPGAFLAAKAIVCKNHRLKRVWKALNRKKCLDVSYAEPVRALGTADGEIEMTSQAMSETRVSMSHKKSGKKAQHHLGAPCVIKGKFDFYLSIKKSSHWRNQKIEIQGQVCVKKSAHQQRCSIDILSE